MKLSGFSLKKGKKKSLETRAGFSTIELAISRAPEKIFVTEFHPDAPVALTEDGKPPLVIPLLKTNIWNEARKSESGCESDVRNGEGGFSEDAKAAAQILAEAQTATSSQPSHRDLVIPVQTEKKRNELFQDHEKRLLNAQSTPILQQNAVPGLDELHDVVDKYRHDVALRPDAPDVHSEVYDFVPVEDFGAALLRGMGWKGDVDAEDIGAAPQPRHKLLGLGAIKRPSLPGKDKKKRKKKKQLKDKRLEENTNDSAKEEYASSRRARKPVDRARGRSHSRSRSARRKRSRSKDRRKDSRREDRQGRERTRDQRSSSRDRRSYR
ncbi:hypothetical protein CCR75_003168 [Bremia lactucae]|uniref:Spp2/MOS2 G-patch domain-containing protein n=1 Tax=Bremia lactucae TaxID=4779 RepID=A0A976NY13_BRELC|nr:hypothetical protein CCR75_003168 [Bremia lactucae]